MTCLRCCWDGGGRRLGGAEAGVTTRGAARALLLRARVARGCCRAQGSGREQGRMHGACMSHACTMHGCGCLLPPPPPAPPAHPRLGSPRSRRRPPRAAAAAASTAAPVARARPLASWDPSPQSPPRPLAARRGGQGVGGRAGGWTRGWVDGWLGGWVGWGGCGSDTRSGASVSPGNQPRSQGRGAHLGQQPQHLPGTTLARAPRRARPPTCARRASRATSFCFCSRDGARTPAPPLPPRATRSRWPGCRSSPSSWGAQRGGGVMCRSREGRGGALHGMGAATPPHCTPHAA